MNDLYQNVTDRIVAAIEAGTPPWIKPWSVAGDLRPLNAATRRPYRGINSVLLGLEAQTQGYARSRWLTYRQAAELGAQVRKGERGTTVVFYKLREVPEAQSEQPGDEKRVIPLLRSFTVFNVAQIEGLPAALTEPPKPEAWTSSEAAEALLHASSATIRHGGVHAYYDRGLDAIHLPARSAFADGTSYYATALHELLHWTGHPARCNRDLKGRFGDAAYAMEELIAEMGSAFLCAHCAIDGRLQHAAYVRAWLPVLKGDKRAVFTAAAKAQAAADYLLQPEQIGEVAA
jgi:antirestriction protein ArdC